MGQFQRLSLVVIKTNWINFLAVFLAVFGYAVILTQFDGNLSYNLFQSILAALILVCGYGIMFWGLFAASLIAFDLLLKINNHTHLKEKLFIEWLLISSPFIFWAFKYHEWIFIVGCIAFIISQTLRKSLIIGVRH